MKAEVVARLRQLERRGLLRPEQVVEDARRNPDGPLYSHFTWDDDLAAAQWRMAQARQLIRSITVEVTTTISQVTVENYLPDPTARNRYVTVESARHHDPLRSEILLDELARALGVMRRASAIAQALDFGEGGEACVLAWEAWSAEVRSRLGDDDGDGDADVAVA
jgi:hypothetical protein